MAPREVTVGPNVPMPNGYAFLKKGIKYKTLHCRRLTHEAGKTVYVVEHKKKAIGIRIPKAIYHQVQALANETLPARRLATQQREATLIRAAATELNGQYPRIPKVDRDMVLKHGFKKYSGRVGRTSQIPMPRKVLYAVIAHIRHTHTKYDEMLDGGMDRHVARKAIQKQTQDILRKWGATQDFSWYFDGNGDCFSDDPDD